MPEKELSKRKRLTPSNLSDYHGLLIAYTLNWNGKVKERPCVIFGPSMKTKEKAHALVIPTTSKSLTRDSEMRISVTLSNDFKDRVGLDSTYVSTICPWVAASVTFNPDQTILTWGRIPAKALDLLEVRVSEARTREHYDLSLAGIAEKWLSLR